MEGALGYDVLMHIVPAGMPYEESILGFIAE